MEQIRPNNAKDELISKLCNKSLRLSYSTLKNFTSPINLIKYKLKPKKKNDSMVFGSLCDCLILTPERFDQGFKIIQSIPTTDMQNAFADELISIQKDQNINEEIIETVFSNHYKRGNAIDTYNSLKEYIDGKVSGKDLITQSLYDEAKELVDNLLSNEDIAKILSRKVSVQTEVKWTDKGWDFIGYLDLLLPDHIVDLKFSKDANPEKFERDIANLDYFLQAAMYCKAAREMGICDSPKYSFIVFDKSYNYSIIELDYSYILYGERKYNFLLQELDRCIYEGSFDESYGFFKRSYTVYKPKWAKGFILEGEEEAE